ncbi:hypothetical protein BH10PLA2_BH10PLA2_24520 [soil metagenome]
MTRPVRHGLTLLETLILIVIVFVGIGLLLPATRRVRQASGRMSCSNNLKQLMLALHNYASNEGSSNASLNGQSGSSSALFPPACFGPGPTPEHRLSWVVAMLPYLEQNALHQHFDFAKGYAGNLEAAQTPFRSVFCPSSADEAPVGALTNYVAMSGIGPDAGTQPDGMRGNGFMGYDRATSIAMIKDGTSNTIALLETRAILGPWARGGAAPSEDLIPMSHFAATTRRSGDMPKA